MDQAGDSGIVIGVGYTCGWIRGKVFPGRLKYQTKDRLNSMPLIDFIPLILFFVVYKMDPTALTLAGTAVHLGGPFSATLVLMGSSVLVYGVTFLKSKRLENNQIVTLVAVLLFGGMTVAFHSETFLKWKAPIVNWLFAIAFLASQYVGKKPLFRRIAESTLSLPEVLWRRLNTAWALFFLFLGSINLFVAFTFHDYWVDFKVFGSLALTVIFVVLQFIFIAKHLRLRGETNS